MNKVPTVIIVIRYICIAFILYFIWGWNHTSIKILLTIIIFHSECLYIANRLKEKQMANIVSSQARAVLKKEIKEDDSNVKK